MADRFMPVPVEPVALDGQVELRLLPGSIFSGAAGQRVILTPEQADALWNAIAEAELVALEQRVRARRRVTEGARGGWVNAPAEGRHAVSVEDFADPRLMANAGQAVDVGMALAESTAAALDRLTAANDPAFGVDPYALPPSHPAFAPARDWVPRHAAPDYQHPEPGDGDDEADDEAGDE